MTIVQAGVDFNTPRIFMTTGELMDLECITIVVTVEHGVDFNTPRIFMATRELKDPECNIMLVQWPPTVSFLKISFVFNFTSPALL